MSLGKVVDTVIGFAFTGRALGRWGLLTGLAYVQDERYAAGAGMRWSGLSTSLYRSNSAPASYGPGSNPHHPSFKSYAVHFCQKPQHFDFPHSRGGVVSCFRTVRGRSRVRAHMDVFTACPEAGHYAALAPILKNQRGAKLQSIPIHLLPSVSKSN